MRSILFALAAVFLAAQVFAAPNAKEGFSGYLDAGFFAMNSTDSLMVSDDNEEIDSLDENSDSFSKTILAVLFEVKYKKNSLVYHAGTPITGGDFQFELGVTKLFGESSFDVSLVAKPMGEVWKDPYVDDRSSTDSYEAGFQLKYEGIAGTPFMTQLKVMGIRVDDDEIGDRYDSMQRDGTSTELSAGYKYQGKGFIIMPMLALKSDNRDGDAESSKGIEAKALFIKPSPKIFLMTGLSIGTSRYDEDNPIFDKTRKDVKAGVFAGLKFNNVFGFKNKHISFMGGVSNRSSNIDFYDAVTYFGGVTFGIDF